MLKNMTATFILGLIFGCLSAPVMGSESADFSPDSYQYYDQARSLDQSSEVVARSRETRTEFANERFVASAGADYWSELQSLWSNNERDPLWASEQVLEQDL